MYQGNDMRDNLINNTEPSFWAKCLKEGVEIKLENSPVKRARKILLGTMIGDASMRKSNNENSKKASLRITHSSSQLEYLIWKAKELSALKNLTFRKPYVWKSENKSGNWKVTLSSPRIKYLKNIYDDFYRGNGDGKYIKVLRENVLNRLTPLSLAIWYGDDGTPFFNNYHGSKGRVLDGFELCTQGFSPEEITLLIDVIKRKFGVSFRRRKVTLKDRSTRYAIRTRSNQDRDTFLGLIKPYLWDIECLRYKLDPNNFKKLSGYSAEDLEKKLQGHDMIRRIDPINILQV